MNPQKPKRGARLSLRAKDNLWHSIKALLCLVQLYALTAPSFGTITAIAKYLMDDVNTPRYYLMLFAVQVGVSIALWVYYDRNDDRSFDRFCEAEEPPRLLREEAYRLGLAITVAGSACVFSISLFPVLLLTFSGIHPVAAMLIALAVGGLVAAVSSVLRLHRLNYVWGVQKTLRQSTDKRLSPVKRILYAAIFFISLVIAAAALAGLLPVVISLVLVLVYLARVPTVIVLCLLAVLGVMRFFRHVGDRRKFLARLESLRRAGELTYTVHGRPYLSLFFRRVPFGLTVVDNPHPESRSRTPVTYRIAIANCNRRRMTVVLCEDNVFQFMYGFNLRVLGHVSTLAPGSTGVMSIPVVSFFVSHTFEFPEGEGKRILLVDPAPHRLCMRGFKRDELIALDNASELYGYTVYGKNSFLNVLERS